MPDTPARLIRLRGARVHNLQGLDLDLPLGRWIVVTGLSGSGKSSLAFDTLHAEGQRRYIETFSAFARQFLDRLDKPDVERIDGIPPSLAVAQRGGTQSARATVGTAGDIHESLALLYAKVGRGYCPECDLPVEPATDASVVAAIEALPAGARYVIGFPIDILATTDRASIAASLRDDGFARVIVDGSIHRLDAGAFPMPVDGAAVVVVDRLTRGSEAPARRLEAIETAFSKGLGRCRIVPDDPATPSLAFLKGRRCGACGFDLPEPDARLFRYNSPLGACATCEGHGSILELDLAKIVPDDSRSIADGAIAPWSTPAHREMLDRLLAAAPALGLPLDVSFGSLSPEQVGRVMKGGPGFVGLQEFFRKLEAKSYRLPVRAFLARYRGRKTCPACLGRRLRREALAYRVGGVDLGALSASTIADAARVLAEVERDEGPAARRALEGVRARLDFLRRIGLDYLTLDRPARSLSDGESRRIALANAVGSGLVNMLYILDEPSVGLHSEDVGRLAGALAELRDRGNTLVVVEHEEELIMRADQLVEIGPGAGDAGGRLVYQGPPEGVTRVEGSATGDFLSGRRRATVPARRREPSSRLRLTGASGRNLRMVDLEIPLGLFTAVSGVSGSGKSTLVEATLHPALASRLRGEPDTALPYRELGGTETLRDVVLVDSAPIGRSSRSNPATFLGAFDEIRRAFSSSHEAKARGYDAGTFSFNVAGGRCETCAGAGTTVVDMQFLADVVRTCTECRGRRYRPEVLEVTYRGKNISEVLDLTAREAFGFFRNRPKIQARLRPLLDLGLDYLRLGQSTSTLSGGEAQRLQLGAFLASTPTALTARAARGDRTLFLLDEPTHGLHPLDTLRLAEAFESLLAVGHTLVVVEHNLELLMLADWIVDLGPGAGPEGGRIVGAGPPEAIARLDTPTGRALRRRLARAGA
ncbi:MAG: excinuclease ABC subunit UvrA [Isosphaeraceae bacterium]|nr:excinuclease ABC subunit UvrA [Isosphaeraceae bacterium]